MGTKFILIYNLVIIEHLKSFLVASIQIKLMVNDIQIIIRVLICGHLAVQPSNSSSKLQYFLECTIMTKCLRF